MNATEFVDLAIRLSSDPREAAQRSAVGRGYYGVFHAARELIESCGVRFEDSAQTHDKLWWCLDQSRDADVATAARKLKSLRTARNNADYDLLDARFKGGSFTSIQLAEVKAIVDCLHAAQSRLADIRPHVRAYARSLRITVVGDD